MEEFDFDAWVEGLKAIPEDRLMEASAAVSRERRERPARAAEEKARAEIVAGLAETAPDLVSAHVTLEESKADPGKVPAWPTPARIFSRLSAMARSSSMWTSTGYPKRKCSTYGNRARRACTLLFGVM